MAAPFRLGGPVLLLLLALLASSRAGAAPRAVPAGGTAVVALAAELQGLDPGTATDRSTWRVLSCLFETLVRPGTEPGQVLPGLAVAWEVSEEGRAWTFHLRRDVYFHDGRPLTAAAVAMALRRQFDPLLTPSPARRAQFGLFRSLLGGDPPILRQVTPVDGDSVRILLREPVRDFLEILAHPPAAIVSPAMAASRAGEALPVGTGPFRFVERRPGQRVTLESNLHYWGGRPPLDYLVFTVVPRASARERELTRGNADLAVALDLSAVDALKASASDRLDLSAGGGLNSWRVVLNCSRQPWSDIRTRLALQQALPRAELARRFGQGRAVPATGVLSPRSWAYDSSEPGYAYEPARAKRLLGRVRLPAAYTAELLYPLESPVLAEPAALAAQVAGRLAAAGLRVRPRGLPPAELAGRLGRGTYDLALVLEEAGTVDPDVELYPAWSRDPGSPGGSNVARYSSGRLQDLLEMARTAPDQAHRLSLYREVQQRLREAAPVVPLAWSLEVLARRRSLNGFTVDRLGLLDFSRAWLGHR